MDTDKNVRRTEEEKLQSEINKNNAEIEKLRLESLEINNRLNKKWFKARFFSEIVIGTIVSSALLVTWIQTYFSPILSAKQEIASLKTQVEKQNNIKLKQEIDGKVTLHKIQVKKLYAEKLLLKEQAKSLSIQLLKLEQDYKELATNQVSEEERVKFQNLADKAQLEVNNLKSLIGKIQYEKNLAVSHVQKLSQSMGTKDNKKYIIAIYALASAEKQYLEIHDYFLNYGYTIKDHSNMKDKPKWMAVKSSIIYYDEKNRKKANELANVMNKITGNQFNVLRGAGYGLLNGESKYKIVIHYLP